MFASLTELLPDEMRCACLSSSSLEFRLIFSPSPIGNMIRSLKRSMY